MLQQSNNTITSIYPIGNQTEELTALYCRLSQDDKQEGDSNSIINHDVMYRGWITPKNITS
jgi:site-specific DNA recombinase